jgi:hypothetical protein
MFALMKKDNPTLIVIPAKAGIQLLPFHSRGRSEAGFPLSRE